MSVTSNGQLFQVENRSIELLEEKMKKMPKHMEATVNKVLHDKGLKETEEQITERIPISNTWRRQSKIHAAHSKWAKKEKPNLGFVIKSKGGAANRKGSFGYLVFPDEGRGRSNPRAHHFMQLGLKATTPKIMQYLHDEVDKILKEEMK